MRSELRAEWYKVWQNKLVWCVFVIMTAFGLYNASFEHEIFYTYKNLGVFLLPELGWLVYAFMTVLFTGYIIGLDFSKRTLHNYISVGVRRKNYYFSRLIVQCVIQTLFFLVGLLAHTIMRLAAQKENVVFKGTMPQMLGLKFVFFMLIILLQLWAYTALFQMVCFLVKNQLVTMVAGMLIVYLEAVLRQMASVYDFSAMVHILNFSPARVLKNSFQYAVYDRFFDFTFWKYGISALGIIIFSSTVGYWCFRYRKNI